MRDTGEEQRTGKERAGPDRDEPRQQPEEAKRPDMGHLTSSTTAMHEATPGEPRQGIDGRPEQLTHVSHSWQESIRTPEQRAGNQTQWE